MNPSMKACGNMPADVLRAALLGLVAAACLFASPRQAVAQAPVTIGTLSAWNGVNAAFPLGAPGSVAQDTYGQTFSAPSGFPVLNDFSLEVAWNYGGNRDADRLSDELERKRCHWRRALSKRRHERGLKHLGICNIRFPQHWRNPHAGAAVCLFPEFQRRIRRSSHGKSGRDRQQQPIFRRQLCLR